MQHVVATHLEHGQEQMLFSRLVLVSVEGEHDGLQEGIDLAERDEPAKGRDMSRFGLQQEEQVRVLLEWICSVSVPFLIREQR